MSIYGPIDGDKIKSSSTDLTQITDNLDMGGNKINNLAEPRMRTDAATAGYVSNYVSHLQNAKVDWTGGTMTGDLSMGNNRITSVGAPVDETDAVNLQYVNLAVEHERLTSVSSLGRYIVIPDESGIKTYFSVRARKNINLDNGKLIEIKHNIADSSENLINDDPQNITITKNTTLMPNPDKKLGVIQLDSQLRIDFKPSHSLPAPWTFFFSARPDQVNNIDSMMSFYKSTGQIFTYISIRWTPGIFKYAITKDVMNARNTIEFKVDTTQLNHIAFEYMGSKLVLWINGMQKRQHNNLTLGNITNIRTEVKELGILSLYNRDLNKMEIIQHFIDHHVENFTNDEVLN